MDTAATTARRAATARRLGASLTAVVVLLAPAGADARRARPAPCPDGIFTVAGTPFTSAGSPVGGRVIVRDGTVALDGLCAAVAAKVRATRRATRVVARWGACPGFPDRVRLKAKIAARDCRTMAGVLAPRRAKPRRQRFRAARPERPAELVATLREVGVQRRMDDENFPHQFRAGAEALNPEVAELVGAGPAALDAVLDAFRRPAARLDDVPLALLAYVLERAGDARAVPVLAAWLEASLFAGVPLALDFVTHALKVLDGQPDLDTLLYDYTVDEMLDAMLRAGTPSGAAARGGARSANAAPAVAEPVGACPKTIAVTGVTADGRTETHRFAYTVRTVDLQAEIARATGPLRARLEELLRGYEENDAQWFGGTDYVAVPGAEVDDRWNCGGAVAERLLNEVARRAGLPVQLGRGLADATAIRDVARAFGREISLIDETEPLLTVIALTRRNDVVTHVEIPIERDGMDLIVFSKDQQTRARVHRVTGGASYGPLEFGPIERRYGVRDFAPHYRELTPRAFVVDPTRILSVTVDSSACPCAFRADARVTLPEPASDQVPTLAPTLRGTIEGGVPGTGGLRIAAGTTALHDPTPQPFTAPAGMLELVASLVPGPNLLRVAVELADGRRGCNQRRLDAADGVDLSAVTSAVVSLERIDLDVVQTHPDGSTTTEHLPDFSWTEGMDGAVTGTTFDFPIARGVGPGEEGFFFTGAFTGTFVPSFDRIVAARFVRRQEHTAGLTWDDLDVDLVELPLTSAQIEPAPVRSYLFEVEGSAACAHLGALAYASPVSRFVATGWRCDDASALRVGFYE